MEFFLVPVAILTLVIIISLIKDPIRIRQREREKTLKEIRKTTINREAKIKENTEQDLQKLKMKHRP